MADIFLSYTEADRDAVRRLALALQSVGWSVWWDRRIPAGKTWRSVLEQELRDMCCMVVVWSARSVQSEWVCEEAAEGRQAGKLIPVRIEAVRPPAGFRELQAADLIGWDGSADFPGLQQLIEDIGRLVYQPPGRPDDGSPPALQPPAAPPPPQPSPPTPPAPPPSPLPVNWWVWGAAGTALLAAAVTGYFAEHWRQSVPTQPRGPVAEGNPGPSVGAASAQAVKPAPSPLPTAPTKPAQDAMATAVVAAPTMPAPTSPPRPTAAARPAKPSAAAAARCGALNERMQLGEALTPASEAFYRQEC